MPRLPPIPVWFISKVPDAVDRYSPFSIPTGLMANRSLFAKFEVRGSLRSDAIVTTIDGRMDRQTDRHSSNVLVFLADQMSSRNLRSQINISRRPIRIDKTMRRV